MVETRIFTCPDCSEEFCNGRSCNDFNYDLYTRIAPKIIKPKQDGLIVKPVAGGAGQSGQGKKGKNDKGSGKGNSLKKGFKKRGRSKSPSKKKESESRGK